MWPDLFEEALRNVPVSERQHTGKDHIPGNRTDPQTGVAMPPEAKAKKKDVADHVAEETLGKKIRKRRRAMDMTLQQLSERVGPSIGFLSQIERGASTPSLGSLCNIAEALGTNVDAFIRHRASRARYRAPASGSPSASVMRAGAPQQVRLHALRLGN
ncbi:helix-turn-helix transcriptional regulator [Shinella zoogloeoides]|uniref:helix-turn-helix domain-containing protein n=1 Tax=Shinella zoogloeoides TaxID=352475 RepID=UPI0028A5C176|nr:helix-turn-helix transcriptional regulator [Shinella zoogloeoides]